MRFARARAAAVLVALVLPSAACADDGGDGGGAAGGEPTTTSSPGPSSTLGSTGSTAATTTPGPGATTAPTTTVALGALEDVAVALTPVAELEQPVAMAVRPGDPALYVASRTGTVHRLVDGELERTPALDIGDDTRAQGEQGLLGLAFSPDGAHAYVNYTDPGGDTHVHEVAWGDDGRAVAGSRRAVLEQEQPFGNHNGGHLAFGPDGLLYIGLGDGGSGGDPGRRAGDLGTWLGKVLRIDPRPDGTEPYGVPADNPLVGRDGARPEIWAHGLRNPWRYSFDSATGDLWVADVGQSEVEEINRVPFAEASGADYGWSALEGTQPFNDDVDVDVDDLVVPVYEYSHGERGCSITGGFVYRGSALPDLVGAYVYADYCAPGVRALRLGPDGTVVEEVLLTEEVASVASFGQDADGELYVLSLGGDTVHRLDPG